MSSFELLKKLYSNETVSKCCKSKLFVQHGNEGTSFYVCKKCSRPCDPIVKEDK